MPAFGWIYRPRIIVAYHQSLRFATFHAAAPHLKGLWRGQDVTLWDLEQIVLGRILPSMDQGQIGSCVGHGWARAVQDFLLIGIASGRGEQWVGEVCREAIYGGSRVEIGGQKGDYSDGSTGAWASQWMAIYGALLYAPGQVSGYYDVARCGQWGADGVSADLEKIAKVHPMLEMAPVTTVAMACDALASGRPVPICGNTSRDMKRSPGGWCPKTGNEWPHCECIRGLVTVKGGPSSGIGGGGAAPYAGDTPAFCEQNSWGDYLGDQYNQVVLASGKTITLPQGVYLSALEDRADDLAAGDTFVGTRTIGWASENLDWIQ